MCTISATWTDCYSFVCATSDPVREMWDQAQVAWEPEGEVKCLVSIGTRVPSLMPFKDAVMGRYYPFNMVEEIGLGKATKVKAVAAERYCSQSDLLACADSISDPEY
jgi:hypothetical protein